MTKSTHGASSQGAARHAAPDGPVPPTGPTPGPRPSLWRARRHPLKARLLTLFLLLARGTTALFLWRARPVCGGLARAGPTAGGRICRPPGGRDRHPAQQRPGPGDDPPAAAVGAHRRAGGQRVVPRGTAAGRPRRFNHDNHCDAADGRWDSWPSRSTADGHHTRFGAEDWRWDDPPTGLVWALLAGLLALAALAYVIVRRLFRPIDNIRAGALRYGAGDFSSRIPVRRQGELGNLATQVTAMVSSLQRMAGGPARSVAGD